MFFRRRKKVAEGGGDAKKSDPAPSPKADPASEALEQATQFITGDREVDQRTIQVLLEAIAQVSEQRGDIDSLLREIVDSSIEVTGAERGLLLMCEDGGELAVRVARSKSGEEITDDLRFSTSVARKVADEREPVRATVNTDAEALDLGRSVFDLKLRAVMCVPLTARDEDGEARVFGVLYVDSRAATRQFSRNNLRVFAALARQISVAVEKDLLYLDSMEKVRLQQNEELAGAIQRDLMPRVPDDLPGFELFGYYGPAERTSGDFYDFGHSKDGRLAIVVGDATGHGVGPALITATAQAGLRSYLRMIADVGEIVTYLNQDLCERVEDGRFLTLFLALLSETGEVEYLNAGHCDPFVWRRETGEFEALSGRNPALGMIDSMTFEAGEPLVLEVGDVLVAYTDGIIEARDPARPDELFGVDGLRQALIENGDKPTRELTVALVERALELSGGVREDDITVVVAKRRA
jgi:serine phosphatase RsbU (regulator of sigma subunit)